MVLQVDAEESFFDSFEKNPKENLDRLFLLANSGSKLCCWYLGDAYVRGVYLEKDFEKAQYWFAKCIDRSSETFLKLGISLEERQQYESSYNAYMAAYKLGNTAAAHNVGLFLVHGLGIEKNINQGMHLIEYSAWRGYILAMRTYSIYMMSGKYGIVNVIPGIILFIKMARKTTKYVFAEKSFFDLE
jgi:TPR repeat protein